MIYEYGSNLDIVWREDPRMLGIRLARYKFVAKMFAGFERVLEVGAGDGFLSKVVKHEVGRLDLTDAHPETGIPHWNPLDTKKDAIYDGVYALDVLEHVSPEDEGQFLKRLKGAMKPTGVLIIGMPSRESQAHASWKSRESHVNCKTETELKSLLGEHFRNVFTFGMNDEVVHTGFGPMCHYRLAIAL